MAPSKPEGQQIVGAEDSESPAEVAPEDEVGTGTQTSSGLDSEPSQNPSDGAEHNLADADAEDSPSSPPEGPDTRSDGDKSPDSLADSALNGLLDAEPGPLHALPQTPAISTSASEGSETVDAPRSGSAVVQYHELVQRLSVDGSIEDWAWEQLDQAREDLGISEEAHRQIVAELVTEDIIEIALRVDAASSQGFILGERCTMVLRLENLEERAIDTARIWFTSSASLGRQKVELERLAPGEWRRLVLPFWPDSAGMHELEGIVELTPLLGSTRFFEFGNLAFRVGRRPPPDLNLDLDPSPVHIQRQPITRGDPLPSPGLLGPPQWRGMQLQQIRRGAAEIWLRQHPIRHPASTSAASTPTPTRPASLRIAAVQAMWGESPPEPSPGVSAAWQGPPLRTLMRECLDSDGEVDRYHSLFEVLSGSERLLATTAGAAFGAQLRTSWEWMRSSAYGAEVCRQIRRHGVEHVQRLLCAPTGWQGQPASFKRRDISGILGHSHDRMEEMSLIESRSPAVMARLRQEGGLDSWKSRTQELAEICQLCSLLIDAYQNIRELDYLKRQELDNMAWSTRRDGLVLYLETAQLLKSLGVQIRPTMRTVVEFREDA